ncbi:MAG: hypothetical protein EBX52_02125 [Proteobacteria bacterium]|nr:hypothetical protein [Pseudomonadota bacterium]
MSTVSDATAYSNSLQRMKESHEQDLAEVHEKHESEVKKLKEEFAGDLKEQRDAAREEVRKLRDELYDSNGRRQAKDLENQHEREAELNRYREIINRDADRKVERVQKYSEAQSSRAANEESSRIEEALKAQKDSNAEAMKPVYQELEMYRSESRDVAGEQARARQEVISDFEEDHLTEKKNLVDSYEKMLSAMRDKEKQSRDLYDRKLTESAVESEAKMKRVSRDQKAEFTEQASKMRRDSARNEGLMRDELMRERTRSVQNQGQLIQQNRDDTEKAMAQKDRAYLDYLAKNQKRVNAELDARERVIQDLSTTRDPRKVSQVVVEKIRSREAERHFENLEKIQDIHKRNLDAIRASDFESRQALAETYGDRTRELARDFKKENDLVKRGMTDVYLDLKEQSEARAGSAEEKARAGLARLQSDHAKALGQEQKRTRMALDEQRDSLKTEKDRALSDAAHEQRMQDREWFMRLSEQKRSFDRQMAQLQDEHERELTGLRLESERKLHEQDRTTRRILEDQERNREFQDKQQAMAYKEKERFLIEHYEEELDKMKHTNAQLVAKKS